MKLNEFDKALLEYTTTHKVSKAWLEVVVEWIARKLEVIK